MPRGRPASSSSTSPPGRARSAVLRSLRPALGPKLGHAGTLDPFATGLLLVVAGRATRLATYLSGLDKRYEAVVQFGAVSTTLDPEGEITPTGAATDAAAVAVGRGGAGRRDRSRRCPAASAVKVDGEALLRAHARAARPSTAPPRHVHDPTASTSRGFDETAQRATIAVECSKGTYVRQIAADLGEATGAGAYCLELRRTAVGASTVADAGIAGRRPGRPDGPLVPGAARRAPAPSSPRARLRGGRGGAPRPRASSRTARPARCASSHGGELLGDRRAARRPPAPGGGAGMIVRQSLLDVEPTRGRSRSGASTASTAATRRSSARPSQAGGGARPALGGRHVPPAPARGAPPGAGAARAVVARAQGRARRGARPRRADRHPLRPRRSRRSRPTTSPTTCCATRSTPGT